MGKLYLTFTIKLCYVINPFRGQTFWDGAKCPLSAAGEAALAHSVRRGTSYQARPRRGSTRPGPVRPSTLPGRCGAAPDGPYFTAPLSAGAVVTALIRRGRAPTLISDHATSLSSLFSQSKTPAPPPAAAAAAAAAAAPATATCDAFHIPAATVSSGWLGSRVVSVLDSGAEGPGFKSQPRRCRGTVLGKLFIPIVPLLTKQQNW